MCGAGCLITVHREFENPGENNAPRKKCCIRETGRAAARAREAGHYRCRRWTVSGLRTSCGRSGGKTQVRGEMVWDSFAECRLLPPAAPGSTAVQLGKGC